MAEILAASSAIAGLLSLTITTIDLSHRYYSSVRGGPKNVQTYFAELQRLQVVLREFKSLTQHPNTAHILSPLYPADSKACQEELERLCAKLRKKSQGGTFSQSLNRLTWPFSEEEIARTVEALNRYQNSITAMLSVSNTQLNVATFSAVNHLRELQLEERARISYQWLSNINPASNHHFARTKHSEGTGQWFLELPQFKSWFGSSCKSLWLHAMSGAGKTVLCSTIIEHVREAQPDEAIAYFYLNHSDSSKSTLSACLRSLLAQLCFFHTTTPVVVAELKSLSKHPGRNGFIAEQELLHALLAVCSELHRCRIVIDALDEAIERTELLEAIKVLATSSSASLLVTSRKEHDIEEILSDVMDYFVALKPTELEQDIGAYVAQCLQTDRELRRRPQFIKERIEEVLMAKSKGMFRWVVCQIEALRLCRTTSAVEEALNSLPHTLDATYERILSRIGKADVRHARAALEFVIFSKRPPTLAEVAEAAVVGSLDGPFDTKNEHRLWEPEEILRICTSLLVLEDSTWSTQVRPAHNSVSEYLLSTRICLGPANEFGMSEDRGDIFMSRMCLRYLLLFDNLDPLDKDVRKDFPLSSYASRWWNQHINSAVIQHDPTTVALLSSFLDTKSHYYFLNSIRLSDPEGHKPRPDLRPGNMLSPLYCLCLFNMCSEVIKLAVNMGFDVNTYGGHGAFALHASIFNLCDIETVDILLKAGANVNAVGNNKTALSIAARNGFEECVDRLLEAGADPCLQTDAKSETALHSAADFVNRADHPECHINIIHLLLQAGADINAINEYTGTSLAVAAKEGHIQVVRALIEAGADVHARGLKSNVALVSAARGGHIQVVKCLLDAGADLEEIDKPFYETALGAAAGEGHMEVVRGLIEAGADVNALSLGDHPLSETAVMKAAENGRINAVDCLLGAGADPNLMGGNGRTALGNACREGHIEVVQRLTEAGAEVDTFFLRGQTGLMDAAGIEWVEIVDCLLEAGADADLMAENGMTALKIASKRGHIDMVRRLLKAGADTNICGPEPWSKTALSEAVKRGRRHVVDCLLEAGADPNIGEVRHESAFDVAFEAGKIRIYKRLIVGAKRKKSVRRYSSCEQTKELPEFEIRRRDTR